MILGGVLQTVELVWTHEVKWYVYEESTRFYAGVELLSSAVSTLQTSDATEILTAFLKEQLIFLRSGVHDMKSLNFQTWKKKLLVSLLLKHALHQVCWGEHNIFFYLEYYDFHWFIALSRFWSHAPWWKNMHEEGYNHLWLGVYK